MGVPKQELGNEKKLKTQNSKLKTQNPKLETRNYLTPSFSSSRQESGCPRAQALR